MRSIMHMCPFCGQGIMLSVEDEYADKADGTIEEQNELMEYMNESAARVCNCAIATQARNREMQREATRGLIEEIVAEEYPAVAEVMAGAIKLLQYDRVNDIKIKIGKSVVVGMGKSKTGTIKITKKRTRTAEGEA